MGFLDSLKSVFSGGGQTAEELWIYVKCHRCGEVLKTRLDLKRNLSLQDDGGYIARKTLVGGDNLCFQRIEVTLLFDESRTLVSQEAAGGSLISEEEYQAEVAGQGSSHGQP